MKEEIFPGIRELLKEDTEKCIKYHADIVANQESRLEKLKSAESLSIVFRISVGTYQCNDGRRSKDKQGVTLDIADDAAESLEDALSKVIKKALAEFCRINSRTDCAHVYLKNILIIAEGAMFPLNRFIGRGKYLKLFNSMAANYSTMQER